LEGCSTFGAIREAGSEGRSAGKSGSGSRITRADRRDFGRIWVEDGTEDRGLVGDNRVAGAGKVGGSSESQCNAPVIRG